MTDRFIKKTQETPKQEIILAKSYRKDYLERVKENSDASQMQRTVLYAN